MALRQQRGRDFVDGLFLAEDHAPQLADEPPNLRLGVGHAIGREQRWSVSSHYLAHLSKYFFTALW